MIIPHYLSVITVGLIYRYTSTLPKKNSHHKSPSSRKFSNGNNTKPESIPVIISNSVRDSINSILIIGGFVIIYNVIIDLLLSSQLINILLVKFSSVLKVDTELLKGVFAGFIELTTGCSRIAASDLNIIIKLLSINFLIGWGGLSILSQAISFISQTDISIKKYISSKFLHGIISSIYTYLLYLAYYKDHLVISSLNNIKDVEISSLKSWLDNIYFSTKMSIGICVFFILLSILVHEIYESN